MFNITDKRYKNVQKSIQALSDSVDDCNTAIIGLKRRILAIEGKLAVTARDSKKNDNSYKKLLEEILGGNLIAVEGDNADNRQCGVDATEQTSDS